MFQVLSTILRFRFIIQYFIAFYACVFFFLTIFFICAHTKKDRTIPSNFDMDQSKFYLVLRFFDGVDLEFRYKKNELKLKEFLIK